MPSLPDELFSPLESRTLQAREAAEKAALNVVQYLGIESDRWNRPNGEDDRRLWLALRARARQFGNSLDDDKEPDPVKRGLPQLIEEIAYEQWHRMLFARFLAENDLLMHPDGVAVTLDDCEQLATEEGEDDAWRLAARYASVMLPGIFRLEDPCAQVRLTPSDHHALESILLDIPAPVFHCDDALGWMYQFWQTKKKKDINDSERKIGGADLPPVTQLFTEDYMVRFLLENSLGAWWAARHPHSPLIKGWEYLRFKEDSTPAAGSFPGWPERAAEVTVMDPCCGSGHFLVRAFEMLVAMRIEEEGLSEPAAADAVLRDNLHGLELDPRCTQIAAFSLALAAWRCGGYRPLPELNLSCSGLPVRGQLADWLGLANGNQRLKGALDRLYRLFENAPELGSLIDPLITLQNESLFEASYLSTLPYLQQALSQNYSNDEIGWVVHASTEATIKANLLLARKYTLIATNVPYLLRGKQTETLQTHSELYFDEARSDLATTFIHRCRDFSLPRGTYVVVSPQSWLYLQRFSKFRKSLLKEQTFNLVSSVGPGGFRTISGEIVNVSLSVITNEKLISDDGSHSCLDVSDEKSVRLKANGLKKAKLEDVKQKNHLLAPDNRITFSEHNLIGLLQVYARGNAGMRSGDYPRFGRCFWELPCVHEGWIFQQSTVQKSIDYGGMEHIILWEGGKGQLYEYVVAQEANGYRSGVWKAGSQVWGKLGVLVSQIGSLPVSIYTGQAFDNNTCAIVPHEERFLPAIWEFCKSKSFSHEVRKIDKSLKVTNASLVKVPFDLAYWQRVADETRPLPEPHSDDPTQWLFNGHPADSDAPLQVALARLLGYRWPQQAEDDLGRFADTDGIACLPAVSGEPPAAERVRSLLSAAYGSDWSPARQESLLAAVGYSGKDMGEWLQEAFFAQHCRLFHNRPFIWHIWDGRKDGFSALVNYHRLDRANLEKLVYSYLGTWLRERKQEADAGIAGAEGRLVAAQQLQEKLKLILQGEPPYDIYVRWKPLEQQPVGWEPDLNDGVRMNIRPFVTAGVLRSKFTINWNKDRGKNPDGSERLNDLHYTLEQKRTQE